MLIAFIDIIKKYNEASMTEDEIKDYMEYVMYELKSKRVT